MDSDGKRTVSEIAEAIGASLPSTSQHLRLMEWNNILESRRERQNIYYRLADNDLMRNCIVLANLPKDKLGAVRPENFKHDEIIP